MYSFALVAAFFLTALMVGLCSMQVNSRIAGLEAMLREKAEATVSRETILSDIKNHLGI